MRRRSRIQTALADVGTAHFDAVDVARLQPVGQREPLGRYVSSLWGRRHFIWADSRARAFSGNRDTVLGRFWIVGRPILDGATYFLIFGVLLGASRGVPNYIGFLLTGVFMFSFTGRALTGGSTVMSSGKTLIRAFSFPRASIPLGLVLRDALSMLPVLAVMMAMILAIPPHAVLTWRWLLFPAVVVLQVCFNAGLVLYTARLTSAVPDLRMLLGLFSRLWMYGSGVMFSLERFITHPTLLEILQLNPAYCVIELTRELLLYGTTPDLKLWLTLAAWAVITPIFGFLYFWQAEEEYGRE
ncbi:ABC transporter permease [Terrabacter aeriphilus]|uniref:Transport permease protein n=1 Tax=Terrabacter aeriphilus TaxID=515662 RepID=A0ABP9J7T7_9MICO